MLKTILSDCSLSRIREMLDGENYEARYIPTLILWGFIFLMSAAAGIGSILYALAIPVIALVSCDAGKLLLYVPDILVLSICVVIILYIIKVIFCE